MNDFNDYLKDISEKTNIISNKILIDFINSIKINNDLINTRKYQNDNILYRVINFITNKSFKTQQNIDENFIMSIEVLKCLVEKLFLQNYNSQKSINILAKKLIQIQNEIPDFTREINSKFDAIKDEFNLLLKDIEINYLSLESEIKKIGLKQNAMNAIDTIFIKWEAGYLDDYPIIVQIIMVFEELFYSDYKCYDDISQELRDIIVNKGICQLNKKLNCSSDTLIPTSEWLSELSITNIELKNFLKYILSIDTYIDNIELIPLSVSVSTNEFCEKLIAYNYLPYIISPKRIIDRLLNEVSYRYKILGVVT